MSTATDSALEELAVNTIRVLSADAVQKANSGHPGLPMGAADFAYVLFTEFLKFDPRDPDWPDRDRFVLSAGHGSMLLYSLLHLCGYPLAMKEIENFRQLGSETPGHPEHGDTRGVETTTGPLGQGFGNAVGMALGEALAAARYNTASHKVVDHHTYVLASDGDLMEGISHEAASLAGHLRLGRLICLYDDNDICLDGPTQLTFTENVEKRFQAYGWHTQRIDGHDRKAVRGALAAARSETERPSLILCKTTIGKGSPNKAGTHKTHGAPLGADEIAAMREHLGWRHPPFVVPEEVRPLFAAPGERGAAAHAQWKKTFSAWERENAEAAASWSRARRRDLPAGWEKKLPRWSSGDKAMATRAASGEVINALASMLPELIGGSADLASSNNTAVKDRGPVTAEDFGGRNLWFGVREHAMGSILNGLSLYGGIRPYGGTFLTFSDYMRPAIRLAALMKQPVIYVFTHDSIFLGEDGPTHQAVEQVAALRAIPNLHVIRPADGNETSAAWSAALRRTDGPTALVLTRQGLPHWDDTGLSRGAERGGYVVEREDGGTPDLILLASGSEVATCRAAAAILRKSGRKVRVVSLPSWEIFDAQPKSYRDEVLPPAVTRRMSVEAGSPFGWERYTGSAGRIHGLDRFGASAPAEDLAEHFGFTPEAVAAAAAEYLG
jgi:transketolase